MNRETIIQMAREAGLAEVTDTAESLPADYVEALAKLCAIAVAKEAESRKAAQLENADLKERLARSGIEQRRAVAKERESCAKVCDSRYMGQQPRGHGGETVRRCHPCAWGGIDRSGRADRAMAQMGVFHRPVVFRYVGRQADQQPTI